jgi:hypothetical protein
MPIFIQDPRELEIAYAVYLFPVIWGVASAVVARERLAAEYALLDRAQQNADDHIARIQGERFELPLDGNTWEYYAPKDRTIGNRIATTVRMIQSLCNEAMANRLPPISTTAQVYATELSSLTRSLRTAQTVALRLGILVTFIGLIYAMGDIKSLVVSDSSTVVGSPESVDNINKILQSMGGNLTKAFGASVAGLLAALVVQLFIELVQAQQRTVTDKIEVVVSTLTNALSLAQVGKAFRLSVERPPDQAVGRRGGRGREGKRQGVSAGGSQRRRRQPGDDGAARAPSCAG